MIAAVFLIFLGVYLAGGILFAVPFVFIGVNKIDPHAAHGSWGFQLLIFSGAIAFWPLLLRRWQKGISEPPEERNAHRVTAKRNRAMIRSLRQRHRRAFLALAIRAGGKRRVAGAATWRDGENQFVRQNHSARRESFYSVGTSRRS